MIFAEDRLVPRQVADVDCRVAVVEAPVTENVCARRICRADVFWATNESPVTLIQISRAPHIVGNDFVTKSNAVYLNRQQYWNMKLAKLTRELDHCSATETFAVQNDSRRCCLVAAEHAIVVAI